MYKLEKILLKNPYEHNGTISSNIIEKEYSQSNKKAYLESYGCQMNFSDSEIVASILSNYNYEITSKPEDASLILLNTCSTVILSFPLVLCETVFSVSPSGNTMFILFEYLP